MLRSALVSAGTVSEDRRESAALVLSELLGNAIRYASPLEDGCYLVAWTLGAGQLALSVSDGMGPTRPALEHPSLTSTRGRGLAIVDTLALTWWAESLGQVGTVHVRLWA